jgi:biopolymer transport protein ExbD
MALGSQQEADDAITGINVTPLVDIVLVLLIIFMVTASLTEHESIEVDLPSAGSSDGGVDPMLMLSIDAQARVFVDGIEVPTQELFTKLRAAVVKEPKVKAVIAADAVLDYARVVELIDTLKGAGIDKFALNLQRSKP